MVIHGVKDSTLLEKGVSLTLSDYSKYSEFLNRIDQIVCADSIPTIDKSRNNIRHKFYLTTPCWDKVGDILIKQRNVIIIHNDSLQKRYTDPWENNLFHLRELEDVIEHDISNNGFDPNWSENAENMIINISVSENNLHKLNAVLEAFVKLDIENDTINNLRIWITDYVPYFKPPSPPAPPPPPPPKQIR
ncbi:hypothetical protein SAMN06265375_1135 [Muriicola jejuensis]|uniref:hypothetical protein n=1 Tax=Muriicola jejuensis TaxID=504488 RepID=UPI001954158B|nr:hypothetical protein [Muriicola jejuensis]SMP27380.1 hypothetical protein SAMN06265375_1135 [Muriicola jejuensis]